MRSRPETARAMRGTAVLLAFLLSSCVVFDNGPTDPFGNEPFVEGFWDIDANVQSSTCSFVDDEQFNARIFQNRDIIQIVVDIAGFGDIRYDGRLDDDGDFFVSHTTVFPEFGTRDDATVDGTFDFNGRTLVATEQETLTELLTGRRCTIVWRWFGSRR